LTCPSWQGHTYDVVRARRHQRLLGLLAFGLLAVTAELAGRSLTHRLDVGRHVARPSYAGGDYYPFLLIAVKVGVALMLARVAWRFAKARATARAARRLAIALGAPARAAPRVRIEVSPRLWLATFIATSVIYLVHADADQLATGRLNAFAPWLHSSALPVFAVLSVLVALLYRGVSRWLADYESYAEETAAYARSLAARRPVASARRRTRGHVVPPRRLFGLSFESRPPPQPA
jgi:hypothetical protein